MTVSYNSDVASAKSISCFIKLLLKWRGSVYKLIWRDLAFFLCLYYALNFTYRFGLDEDGRKVFENLSSYCRESSSFIPLSFVLGFYVSTMMTRWWNQYQAIPRPDSLAVYVSATIHGQDERGRVMRRTIMRYVCLSITMLFTNIATKVKKRFPTLEHFVTAGLMETNEAKVLANLNEKFPLYSKHWLPLIWAASIITRARKEYRIRDDFAVKTMLDEINKIRAKCGTLSHYDRISVPLVYTQVVTIAVYSYFLATLMGHQWIENNDSRNDHYFDLYFPIFTVLHFIFYMGWLKVALSLINPFGDDDDDFELNWMVDKNLKTAYLIVDEMHDEHPELIKDQYWDEVFPQDLPYTKETEPFKEKPPQHSTINVATPLPGDKELVFDKPAKKPDQDPIHIPLIAPKDETNNSEISKPCQQSTVLDIFDNDSVLQLKMPKPRDKKIPPKTEELLDSSESESESSSDYLVEEGTLLKELEK